MGSFSRAVKHPRWSGMFSLSNVRQICPCHVAVFTSGELPDTQSEQNILLNPGAGEQTCSRGTELALAKNRLELHWPERNCIGLPRVVQSGALSLIWGDVVSRDVIGLSCNFPNPSRLCTIVLHYVSASAWTTGAPCIVYNNIEKPRTFEPGVGHHIMCKSVLVYWIM